MFVEIEGVCKVDYNAGGKLVVKVAYFKELLITLEAINSF